MATSPSITRSGVGGQSELRRFRDDFYDCLTRWPDAQFELVDALSSAVRVGGIAHLTLAASARRGHGSAYAAIASGGQDVEQIRDVLAAYRPTAWGPTFAIDTSLMARPKADCSPGRGFYHHAHPQATLVKNQPITIGWNYSWLVALSPQHDSWTAPLDIVRMTDADTVTSVAVAQVKALMPRLDGTTAAALFVYDGGYDPVTLTVELGGEHCQSLIRLRNDRVMWTRPPEPAPRNGLPGRPKRHGTLFHFKHPTSWHTPDATLTVSDQRYGTVTVQAWTNLHPNTQHTYRDPDGKTSIIEATILRLHVQHLPGRHHGPGPTPPIWLWWTAPTATTPDLDRLWRAYLHRFDIEHTFRFARQELGWNTPKVRHPEQADRWTWLIAAAFTQLRLARPHVTDHHLPWQHPLPNHQMTPGRVRAGFTHLAAQIDTPATWPKPSRPGPGRPPGHPTTPAPRHEPFRKTKVKPTKEGTKP